MSLNSLNACDVKMLVLKRWDMDQTKQLFDSGRKRSSYISFQGYHFIEILSTSESNHLSDIYRSAQTYEDNHQDLDIHTVQSMTLIADCNNDTFWNASSERLGITFLQLTDSTEWHYNRIIQKAQSLFTKNDQWSLYYSLDFCDLVLFTKNMEFNHFNDILWKLALIREGELKVICDTFTILSFSADYLQAQFQYMDTLSAVRMAEKNLRNAKLRAAETSESFHHAEAALEKALSKANAFVQPAMWGDRLSLIVNLSIKNVAALFDLLEKLTEQGIEYLEHRLPGRYDVNLFLNNITGQDAITVLYLIDQLSTSASINPDTSPIGNYEVIFMANKWSGKKRLKYIPQSQKPFEQTVLTELNHILEDFSSSSSDLREYIFETLRATRELASTGFSEEFILSTYPSITTFVKLLDEINHFLQYDSTVNLTDSRNSLAKNYFTALNTLSICTMHSERQFIHAPAFNAIYFEIPPKLLAFYSAFVFLVSNAISTHPRYCYMLTPDFRSDINVQPLHINHDKDTENHLAIIHLPERYFYDPQSALMLLSHEVGHYEGDRKRQMRAHLIFDMVSMVVLLDTGLFPCETSLTNSADDTSLLGVLSHALGDFLLAQFHLYFDAPNRGIIDHLSDISDFLHDCDFCAQFFQQHDTRQQISHCWKQALASVDYNDSDQVEAVLYILQQFDKQENTVYYSQLLSTESITVVFDPLSQFVAEKVQFSSVLSTLEQREMLISQCEMIIQAFSETYADMQMVRILGESFSIEQYLHLIMETKQSNSIPSYQNVTAEQVIRCNAVCNAFQIPLPDDAFLSDHLPTNTVIQKVTQYLQACLNTPLDNPQIIFDINAFLKASPFDQCEIISNVLYQYKELLTNGDCYS